MVGSNLPPAMPDLPGTHHFYTDNRDATITAKSLLGFLKWALLKPDLALPDCAGTGTCGSTPFPGVSYLIGIADLYDTMCILRDGRSKPEISITQCDSSCLKVLF